MKNKLRVGDKAPKIETLDVNGKRVNFSKSKKDYLLVAFLRYAGCPWCNLALHRLVMEYPILLDSNIEVLVFIQSHESEIQNMIFKRHAKTPKFWVVADQELNFYKKYYVKPKITATAKSITKIPHWIHAVKEHGFKQGKIDGNLLMVPATFVIKTSSSEIVYANYGSSFYEHEVFENIYDATYLA